MAGGVQNGTDNNIARFGMMKCPRAFDVDGGGGVGWWVRARCGIRMMRTFYSATAAPPHRHACRYRSAPR